MSRDLGEGHMDPSLSSIAVDNNFGFFFATKRQEHGCILTVHGNLRGIHILALALSLNVIRETLTVFVFFTSVEASTWPTIPSKNTLRMASVTNASLTRTCGAVMI